MINYDPQGTVVICYRTRGGQFIEFNRAKMISEIHYNRLIRFFGSSSSWEYRRENRKSEVDEGAIKPTDTGSPQYNGPLE